MGRLRQNGVERHGTPQIINPRNLSFFSQQGKPDGSPVRQKE
jgi:hypothetical protein